MAGKLKTTIKKTPRVIIGVPCQDMMKSSTAHSIGCLAIGDPTIVDFLIYKGCDIVSSRTWLVKEAIRKGGTHLLFVDSDMIFPSFALKQLLSHEKEVISVNYNKRKFPLEKVTAPLEEESETELYKAKGLGTGFMLIDLSIFTNPDRPLGLPWFNFGRGAEGQLVLGEDTWFVNTVREAGYDAWIDPTIKVFHSGEYNY